MHQDFFPPGIAVLTGAGISKESGIDTFRDADGLWNRVNLEEVATLEAWHRDKKKVLDFYNETRSMFRAAGIGPNEAHRALARLERDVGIGVETLALFVRFWLNTTPPLPEPAAKAARAQAGARYDNFVAALGRRLNEGPKLRQEIPDDVQESGPENHGGRAAQP